MTGRPSPYTEKAKFIIKVLWLHGASEAEIAKLLQQSNIVTISKGAVSGIVTREDLRNLSLKDRQNALDRLVRVRLDDGHLGSRHFRAKEKAAGRKVDPLKPTAPGRAGAVQDILKGNTRNPTIRNNRASVAEYLQTGTLLNDPLHIFATDDTKGRSQNYGDIRKKTALEILAEHDAVYSEALGSPDWMKEGHATPGSMTPAEWRIWMAEGQQIYRRRMPRDLLKLLDRAIIKDEFFWESKSSTKRARDLEMLRMALDFATFIRSDGQHLLEETLIARWEPTGLLPAFRGAVMRARSRAFA
jgi:hypothetical protein